VNLSGTSPIRFVIRRICTSIGNIFLLHANNKTQAAVLGPTPVSDVRNSQPSSTCDVFKNERSSSPLLFLISLSAFLMVTDLALANPPDLIAAAMDDRRARRADSQSGKRRLKFSKALRLFMSVVGSIRSEGHKGFH
jgi:hypothetical protein